MSEILALLRVLPELISLLIGLSKLIKEQFGDNPEKFILDCHEAFQALKAAKTKEEKRDAARAIADLIKRL
jgi:hypothetical protein